MKTDPKARIAELEDKLERAYAEINSQSSEITELEYEIEGYQRNQGAETMANFVANAIHRRDVLGLDDGDVLSIIHEKLEKSY